jgi:ribosomal protein S18 acetylase RimI-like enzyme
VGSSLAANRWAALQKLKWRRRLVPRNALRVRPFSESDEASVVALWNEVFAGDPPRNEPGAVIDRKLRVQRELFLVGELQGDVVGTVVAGFDGYRGWVYHLAVHPRCRRRGFGRQLMREAEARLRALGCPKLNLQVRSSNTEVIAFYERLGYSIEDRASLGKILQ